MLPVAVAISTIGRPAALARCLRSLAAGPAVPAEVVVVDQSPDGSAAAAAASVPTLNVRHVTQAPLGLGAAQNEAVRQTAEEIVAVLDDDCVAAPDWVALVHDLLGADLLDLVGGRVLPLEDGAAGLHPVASRTSTTPRTFRSRVRPWEVGSGNNFAVRRAWFERVGGCDVRLGPGSPGRGAVDIDLFYRLLRAGARAGYEPALVVFHERKTRDERLARRVPYGYGMGVACAKWLREGDRCAARVLAAWVQLRAARAAGALPRRRWPVVWEELLVLGGTAQGLSHGFRTVRGGT